MIGCIRLNWDVERPGRLAMLLKIKALPILEIACHQKA
jgi:hypothetical protein